MTITALDLQAAIDVLAQYEGIDSATWEYPGFVLVLSDGAAWQIGTVNGPLQADYYEDADSATRGASPSKTINIPLKFQANSAEIAEAIYSAMTSE